MKEIKVTVNFKVRNKITPSQLSAAVVRVLDHAVENDIEDAEVLNLDDVKEHSASLAVEWTEAERSRELATILHGLRLIQCEGRLEGCAAGDCEHFEEDEALTNEEIDALCEKLNCGGYINA